MRIGHWTLKHPVCVAPMAGVTDRPYRRLCRELGAPYAVSEMAASKPELRDSVKTTQRTDHQGETSPIAVQIVGADPAMLADAALFNIRKGAQIIDINMGCPARKVCATASGSALLRDEALVARILQAVVAACAPHDIAVTLKTRTGWDRHTKNAVRIARLAEDCGIAALTLHGRTRCDHYQGSAEYDTIRAVRAAIKIPLIANGDIDSPAKARQVLDYTGADAVMIGRAAQGRPWIFREISHFLATGQNLAPPTWGELGSLLLGHLEDHYTFYGKQSGVRSARKHLSWYLRDLPGTGALLARLLRLEDCAAQTAVLGAWLAQQPADEAITLAPRHPN